jgi:uncharacterized protein
VQRISLEQTAFSNATHGAWRGVSAPIRNVVPPSSVLNPEPWNVTSVPPLIDGEFAGSTRASTGPVSAVSRLNGPMAASELVINARELMRVPGTRRVVDRTVALADLEVDDPRLTGAVTVHLLLESSLDDIDARGDLTVRWSDECRRCLRPLSDELWVSVDERYAEPDEDRPLDPTDLDTFPIVGGQFDLRPMVREGLLLGVPDAPLCRDDCPGLCPTCGADLSEVACGCAPAERDERWAVLEQLRER